MSKKTQSFFDNLQREYWKLSRVPRRIVGWSVLILFFCFSVLLGYGLYRGGKGLGQLVKGLWASAEFEEYIPDFSAEYSGSGPHRSFRVMEKKPNRFIRNYRDLFNDVNDVQLAAARQLGISPLQNRSQIASYGKKLIEVSDTRYYVIDNLTKSAPYLVPDAADFLTDLGRLFQEYNGTKSRFIITSILRTEEDVTKLRRGNVNASPNSCHRYGTTFDIVYTRFDRHGQTTDGQIKLDLARALADLRDAGHCYVKYEVKQPCFHITVRPR